MKNKMGKLKSLPPYMYSDVIKYALIAVLLLMIASIVIISMKNVIFGFTLIVIYAVIISIAIYLFNYLIDETEHYINKLSYRIHKGEQEALIKMPIGMLLYNEKHEIQWLNPQFRAYFKDQLVIGRNLKDVDKELYRLIEEFESGKVGNIDWNDKQFQVVIQKDIRMIYMLDISKYANIEKKYHDEQIVFGQIFIDNFAEVSQPLTDRKKSNLNNFVTNQLTKWAKNNNVYLKRVDDDRFIAVLNKRRLKSLEHHKFEIVDKIRETTAKQNYPLTLSMGFAYLDKGDSKIDYNDVAVVAQSNLDLALGRGGDQVVVRSKNESARFYGGKTDPMEKRTRVRSRMVAQALNDMILEADAVFVMGHRYPDMDVIGSSLGIRRIADINGKKAFIVLDDEQYSKDIHKLVLEIKKDKDLAESFVTPQEAAERITSKSLMVLVDVHKPSLTISPDLIERSNQTIVIDHHRRGEEAVANSVLMYIEPYASSASELITELFHYQQSDNTEIKSIEATALLGGIIVDTRNFLLRTGTRTFDAASYLKSCGADSILIQKLMKENIDTYRQRSHLIESLEILEKKYGIVFGEDDTIYSTVVTAQTADTMLSMENIDASFVVTLREDHQVGISARSLGEINVQSIMEKLGGGGHLTNAATQMSNVSVQEAVKQLKEIIQNNIDTTRKDGK